MSSYFLCFEILPPFLLPLAARVARQRDPPVLYTIQTLCRPTFYPPRPPCLRATRTAPLPTRMRRAARNASRAALEPLEYHRRHLPNTHEPRQWVPGPEFCRAGAGRPTCTWSPVQRFPSIPAPNPTLPDYDLTSEPSTEAQCDILTMPGPMERCMFLFHYIPTFISLFYILFRISAPTRVRRGVHVLLEIYIYYSRGP